MKTLYIPKLLIKDSNLTLKQKKVAYYLFHSSSFEEEHIIPSARELAKKLNMSAPTVSKAFDILQEYEYLEIKENNFYIFKINGIEFKNSNLKTEIANKMAEDFSVIPTVMLFYPEISAAELDSYIKFFDRNFKINGNKFFLKNDTITTADKVAEEWNCDVRTMQHNLQTLKNKGLIDYKTVPYLDSEGERGKVYISFKFFTVEQIWVIHNGKTTNNKNEVIKTKEQTYDNKTIDSEAELLENELLEKEEYIPSEEDREEVDRLLLNLKACFKLEYERDIKYYRLDDQIVWLRKRQN